MTNLSLPPLLVPKLKGPTIDRSIRLQFKGDWGQMNLHRVCCWLSMEVGDRTGPDTQIGIWNGRGGADEIFAVAKGEVDMAITTPVSFAGMALNNVGPYTEGDYSHLRTIGYVPQDDRLVLSLKKDLGITSFADLREKKPALKIATSPDDGINMIGFGVQRIMEAAGISRAEFESWGGEFIEAERPHESWDAMLSGEADGMFHEAIMAGPWQEITNKYDMVFLPIEDEVLTSLEQQFGWQRAVIKKGYFRGHEEDIEVIDFAHFLLVVREDMPEDIAHLLAWSLCETKHVIEDQYSHIPQDRSPISYPLKPEEMHRSPIPLHKGAHRYFSEAGLLD